MTNYTVTIKDTQTGKAIPGFKVTGLTLAEVEEARQVFTSHTENARLLAEGLVDFVVKPDAPKYTTLKLTDEQVKALVHAINIYEVSYQGIPEEELEGTGVTEDIETHQEILAKLAKAGWTL